MSVAARSVSASEYLRDILAREAVDRGPGSALAGIDGKIATLCSAWGSRHIIEVTAGGGFAKSMANRSGISVDYVVWIHAQSEHRIIQVYELMFAAFGRLGLAPVRRDVTMALRVGDFTVDLLPVKRLSMISDIHEIYSARRSAAITTNLYQHELDSHDAGWQDEVRILKLWRDQNGLDFPSYYLERPPHRQRCVVARLERSSKMSGMCSASSNACWCRAPCSTRPMPPTSSRTS